MSEIYGNIPNKAKYRYRILVGYTHAIYTINECPSIIAIMPPIAHQLLEVKSAYMGYVSSKKCVSTNAYGGIMSVQYTDDVRYSRTSNIKRTAPITCAEIAIGDPIFIHRERTGNRTRFVCLADYLRDPSKYRYVGICYMLDILDGLQEMRAHPDKIHIALSVVSTGDVCINTHFFSIASGPFVTLKETTPIIGKLVYSLEDRIISVGPAYT